MPDDAPPPARRWLLYTLCGAAVIAVTVTLAVCSAREPKTRADGNCYVECVLREVPMDQAAPEEVRQRCTDSCAVRDVEIRARNRAERERRARERREAEYETRRRHREPQPSQPRGAE